MQAKLFKCKACGKSKPRTAEYFYRGKRYKDGLRSECKICSKKQDAKYNERVFDVESYSLNRYGPIMGPRRFDAWHQNRIRIQKRLGIFTD